ncbi:MAG: 16S rRNA (guanine(527)-N(7))-methyltransferase RsmG [Phycisphaerales bacterium]|nr:16S rRNA (guanine(527)-N(7))-methyltransferase RsmG [Phycisphaerales bacterium]
MDEHRPHQVDLDFDTTVSPLSPPPEFTRLCADYGLAFDDGDLERLGRHLALLYAANQVVNLTAVRDVNEAWIRHVFDSLTLIPLIVEVEAGSRIADVGTGGGMPGIPLAITLPEYHVTLIEATGKKVQFLRKVAEVLDLKNVEVVQGRSETMGQETSRWRETFDVVCARALGPLNVALELTVPLMKPGGRALLTKGARAAEELEHAALALRELKAVHAGTVETPTGRIVVVTKHSRTPRLYPRRDGEPKRAPIGGRLP